MHTVSSRPKFRILELASIHPHQPASQPASICSVDLRAFALPVFATCLLSHYIQLCAQCHLLRGAFSGPWELFSNSGPFVVLCDFCFPVKKHKPHDGRTLCGSRLNLLWQLSR